MALEQFANDASTTLNGAITNVATSLVVTSASLFPSVGNFRIRVENEIILVTAVSGTTFTVTRAQEGTAGVAHGNGVGVAHVLTTGAVSAFRENNCRADTLANQPAASREGALFVPTNGLQFTRDTGSVWNGYGPLFKFKKTPAVADFTWVNQGSATATDQGGTIYMTDPAHNGISHKILVKSAPSPPYTITAAFSLMLDSANSNGPAHAGLLFRDGVNKLANIRLGLNTGTLVIGVANWSTPTALNSLLLTMQACAYPLTCIFLRIEDDNTNRKYYISHDGINFKQVYSEARTTYFTATQVGWYLDNNIAAGTKRFDSSVTLLSWEEA